MTTHYDVLIVGSGHAGAQAAAALRQRGFAGTVALLGEEAEPPYERPPLSKAYLAGEQEFARLLLRPAGFWAERGIDLLPGRRVTVVDADARRVTCADGGTLDYGTLVWATGGSPRRLSCSGHDLAGVHAIRTRGDVDRLRAELPAAARIAVIGAGYVGLEAAAVLTTLGKRVTVLEAQDRVLARVAGPVLSDFYAARHRAHGVDLRLGVTVACLEERAGAVAGVRLADGCVVAADLVIVGVGIEPAVAPLLAAGAAAARGGVAVDAVCQTALSHVHAIGDCAAHASRYADGATIRLESVQNATDQANVVARVLTGEAAAVYDAVPWFWSNQYDLRLQTVGLAAGYDATVLRGDPDAGSFSLVYLRGGRVAALDCVNATRDYVQGRALVAAGAVVPADALADAGVPLKALLASA